MARIDGRRDDELRSVSFERHFTRYAEGAVLATFGETRVLCTATLEEKVPPFLRGAGKGWITAEYAMLPRATHVRTPRSAGGNGRSAEIQRLVGRSLRSAVRLDRLGERTIWLDCDVLQADGGTRTTAISGAFVALVDCLRTLFAKGVLPEIPLASFTAAVSVGKVDGRILLDLCYEEDSAAEVDCNVVMNESGRIIELQGTGEGGTFDRGELNGMLDVAEAGVGRIIAAQRAALSLSDEEIAACASRSAVICER